MKLNITVSKRAIMIGGLVVLAILSQTQALSEYPFIDAPLSDRVFVLFLLGLFAILGEARLGWLTSKLKINKQQHDQTQTLARILTTLPPDAFHHRFMESYKLCRGRWELLIPINKPVDMRGTVIAPEQLTAFHYSVIEEILKLARLWDGEQGTKSEGYGFQVYWEHGMNNRYANTWIPQAWEDGWYNTPLQYPRFMLSEAQGVLVQDLELTQPKEKPNARRRIYTYSGLLGRREIINLPGLAKAYAEKRPQYIADTHDLKALYQTMGGQSDYSEEVISCFLKQHPDVRSMIALPIPGNHCKQDTHKSMGVILLTSESPNFIGEKQVNAFAHYMLPFIWFLADVPPTQEEYLRKAGRESNEK